MLNSIQSMSPHNRAILYIFRRKIAPHKMYIGMKDYNKGKDPSGYISSSQSDEFWEDNAKGLLEKFVLFENTVEYISSLEWYGIDYLVNSQPDLSYHLSSNGHRGNVKLKTEDMQYLIDLIDGKILPKKEKKNDRVKIVEDIIQDLMEGTYPKQNVNISVAMKFKENQVKGVSLDQHQIDEAVRRMLEHPEKARNEIKPLVACVMADGDVYLLNGHHTREMVNRCPGWNDIDVIYLRAEQFGDTLEEQQSNFNLFGLKMNPQGFVLTKATTKDDCVKDLEREVKRLNLNLSDYNHKEKAKDLAKQLYGGPDLLGTTAAAVGVWKTVVNNFEKNKAATSIGQVFTYSDRELTVMKRRNEASGYSVVVATFKQAEHAKALGYILRHMKNESNKKGLVIFHCRTPDEYVNEIANNWIEDMRNTIEFLELDVEIKVLKSMNEGDMVKDENDAHYEK
jgi:hypothetical protein